MSFVVASIENLIFRYCLFMYAESRCNCSSFEKKKIIRNSFVTFWCEILGTFFKPSNFAVTEKKSKNVGTRAFIFKQNN